jgi:ElaB/YqjD/DUF883 family membrane-anchored ribosome-binding protein
MANRSTSERGNRSDMGNENEGNSEVTFTPDTNDAEVQFNAEGSLNSATNMTTPPPEAVSKSIDNVSDKAKDAVDRASEGLKHTAAQANTQIHQISTEMRERAYSVKGNASQSLRQAAQNLREQVRTGEGQPVQQAESLAMQLDKMAGYLDDNSFEEIQEDAKRTIQKNPWQSVGAAAVVGFIFARLFGGRR